MESVHIFSSFYVSLDVLKKIADFLVICWFFFGVVIIINIGGSKNDQ